MVNVVILCAGQGNRMLPLTQNKPKSLINFAGMTLLQRQINVFDKLNLKNIYIVTGFKAKSFKDLNLNKNFFHNPEFKSTNMVSSLFCNSQLFDSKTDLIISYGDIVFNKEVIISLLESNHDINVVIDKNWKKLWDLRFKNPLDDAESLIHDENYNLQEIGYKTKYYNNIQGQYIGLIKIQGSKLSKILDFYKSLDKSILYDGNSFKNMYMTTFIQLLINKNWSVKSVPIFSGWLEFDSINDLNLYNKLYRKNKLKTFININLK